MIEYLEEFKALLLARNLTGNYQDYEDLEKELNKKYKGAVVEIFRIINLCPISDDTTRVIMYLKILEELDIIRINK